MIRSTYRLLIPTKPLAAQAHYYSLHPTIHHATTHPACGALGTQHSLPADAGHTRHVCVPSAVADHSVLDFGQTERL